MESLLKLPQPFRRSGDIASHHGEFQDFETFRVFDAHTHTRQARLHVVHRISTTSSTDATILQISLSNQLSHHTERYRITQRPDNRKTASASLSLGCRMFIAPVSTHLTTHQLSPQLTSPTHRVRLVQSWKPLSVLLVVVALYDMLVNSQCHNDRPDSPSISKSVGYACSSTIVMPNFLRP